MLQRKYFARYEIVSKKLLQYRDNQPLKLVKEYENSLAALREHLYQNRKFMPLPLYPYDPEDRTTHSFIRDIDNPRPIKNPHYKYKDTWCRIDGVRGVR